MLTRILSFIGLVTLIALAAIAVPNYVRSFESNPSVTAIMMTGLVVLSILAGAVMLLLFGVIGVGGGDSGNKGGQ